MRWQMLPELAELHIGVDSVRPDGKGSALALSHPPRQRIRQEFAALRPLRPTHVLVLCPILKNFCIRSVTGMRSEHDEIKSHLSLKLSNRGMCPA